MQRENRGKKFEDVIKTSFLKVPNCSVDRIHDQVSGFAGSTNISDFIVYKQPFEYYIECKCVYGNTLPFANITRNQWRGMLEKSRIQGVCAGVICWFQDHDKTIFIPIQNLEELALQGDKSVNINKTDDAYYIELEGYKKRVFFEYDMQAFFQCVEGLWVKV